LFKIYASEFAIFGYFHVLIKLGKCSNS